MLPILERNFKINRLELFDNIVTIGDNILTRTLPRQYANLNRWTIFECQNNQLPDFIQLGSKSTILCFRL